MQFAGVTKFVDRHGKTRWRARRKGRPSVMLPGPCANMSIYKPKNSP